MEDRIEINWTELTLVAGFIAIFAAGTVVFGNPLFGVFAMCGVALLVPLSMVPKRLLYGLIVYSMVIKYLVSDIGLPSAANYVCDGLLLLTILAALKRPREGYVPSRGLKLVAVTLFAFWFVASASALLNSVSPILYIWACRNTFRLFGILFCCVRLFDCNDVDRLIKIYTIFFWINLVVCIYQYYVLGTGQDNTNGLFGTGSGGNAMMVILLFTVSAFCLFGYSLQKKSAVEAVVTLVACCFLAAIAELKVYYALLVLLAGLSLVLNRLSFKSIVIALLSLAALGVGLQLLESFYPEFAGYLSLENIIQSSTEGGYSSDRTLNRLSAVETIDSMFLRGCISRALGLGFGAGQFTQFFEAPLYSQWGEVLHWTWFTDAVVFLETGYMGLVLYIAIFVIISLQVVDMRKKSGDSAWLVTSCASVAVLCLVLIVYNCSLTVDPSCYFIGVLLAFPYVLDSRRATNGG